MFSCGRIVSFNKKDLPRREVFLWKGGEKYMSRFKERVVSFRASVTGSRRRETREAEVLTLTDEQALRKLADEMFQPRDYGRFHWSYSDSGGNYRDSAISSPGVEPKFSRQTSFGGVFYSSNTELSVVLDTRSNNVLVTSETKAISDKFSGNGVKEYKTVLTVNSAGLLDSTEITGDDQESRLSDQRAKELLREGTQLLSDVSERPEWKQLVKERWEDYEFGFPAEI